MVGHVERRVHQLEDRTQETLGLSKREVEDQAERQGGLDSEVRVLGLGSALSLRLRVPLLDGRSGEPEGDAAAVDERDSCNYECAGKARSRGMI